MAQVRQLFLQIVQCCAAARVVAGHFKQDDVTAAYFPPFLLMNDTGSSTCPHARLYHVITFNPREARFLSPAPIETLTLKFPQFIDEQRTGIL